MYCILVGYQSFWTGPIPFWTGPNHFGQVQISPEKSNLKLTKMILPVQSKLDPTKIITYKYAVYMTLCSAGLLKESCYKLYKNADFQFFHLV